MKLALCAVQFTVIVSFDAYCACPTAIANTIHVTSSMLLVG